jgi:4a-hydroxytetrahydrobiopterin dehydratase
MSEQGWREFLTAEAVDGWVVLHGGATAVFRVPSLGEAARLAEAVANVPGLEGAGALLTIGDNHLSVRLSRGVFRLEEHHIDLARAVSAIARAQGALADRTAVQEVQLAIAAKPETIDVGFWRAVLGYAGLADDNAVDPLGHGSTVWMQELNADKPLRHAMHVDVSVARERAETRVAAALAPVAASSTTPTPLPAGSSQIAPATAFASPHGPTGPYPLLLLICSRAEVAMGIRCMRLPDLPMSVRMRDALPGGPWWQGTQSAQMSGSPGKHGISSLGGSGRLRSNRRSPRRRRRFLPGCCGRGRCECDSGQAS